MARVQKRGRLAAALGPRSLLSASRHSADTFPAPPSARRDTRGLTEARWLLWPQSRSYIPTRMHSVGQRGLLGFTGNGTGNVEPTFGQLSLGFPGGSAGEESACNAGHLGSIPGLGRSPGEGKGYPLQSSGLENPMDCRAHGVAKTRTGLSDFYFHFHRSTACITNSWRNHPRCVSLWLGQPRPLQDERLVVQSLNCVRLAVTPWTAAGQASLTFRISWSLLKFTSIELVMSSNHLIFCRPLLLLPSNLFQHQGLSQ